MRPARRCQGLSRAIPKAEAIREQDPKDYFSTHCQTADVGACAVSLYHCISPSLLIARHTLHTAFMDVSSLELKGDIAQWDENEVNAWFATLGYPQYGNQIRGASV